jgi:hypothetical protein
LIFQTEKPILEAHVHMTLVVLAQQLVIHNSAQINA